MNPRTIATWLVPFALVTTAAGQDEAKRQYDELTKAYDQAFDAYRAKQAEMMRSEAYLEARKQRDMEKLNELRASVPDPKAEFVSKFQAAAGRFEGQSGAVPFLLWLVSVSRDTDAARAALGTLLEKHVGDPAIAPLVVNAPYTITSNAGLPQEEGLAALGTLIDAAPTEEIRAHALYARAMTLQRDRNASDELKAQAAEDVKRARLLSEGTLLATRIDAPEFEKQHLQIGMVAPDIHGKDVDGVEFKLSDYRGKVVVLDFWGDW